MATLEDAFSHGCQLLRVWASSVRDEVDDGFDELFAVWVGLKIHARFLDFLVEEGQQLFLQGFQKFGDLKIKFGRVQLKNKRANEKTKITKMSPKMWILGQISRPAGHTKWVSTSARRVFDCWWGWQRNLLTTYTTQACKLDRSISKFIRINGKSINPPLFF